MSLIPRIITPFPKKKHLDGQDKAILEREAKAINAQFDWYRAGTCLYIYLTSPPGFVWASTSETELTFECPYTQSRDAVTELLVLMGQGFVRSSKPKYNHEHDCECESCESSDEEIYELDF